MDIRHLEFDETSVGYRTHSLLPFPIPIIFNIKTNTFASEEVPTTVTTWLSDLL
jgi:hypothetical protein